MVGNHQPLVRVQAFSRRTHYREGKNPAPIRKPEDLSSRKYCRDLMEKGSDAPAYTGASEPFFCF